MVALASCATEKKTGTTRIVAGGDFQGTSAVKVVYKTKAVESGITKDIGTTTTFVTPSLPAGVTIGHTITPTAEDNFLIENINGLDFVGSIPASGMINGKPGYGYIYLNLDTSTYSSYPLSIDLCNPHLSPTIFDSSTGDTYVSLMLSLVRTTLKFNNTLCIPPTPSPLTLNTAPYLDAVDGNIGYGVKLNLDTNYEAAFGSTSQRPPPKVEAWNM